MNGQRAGPSGVGYRSLAPRAPHQQPDPNSGQPDPAWPPSLPTAPLELCWCDSCVLQFPFDPAFLPGPSNHGVVPGWTPQPQIPLCAGYAQNGAQQAPFVPPSGQLPLNALQQRFDAICSVCGDRFNKSRNRETSCVRHQCPVSAALSTGIWPCCGLPAEFDGCMSTYHIEKVDKMEPEGSPKGKGPRASGKRDGKRKVSEESAEQGPLKRSHLSTSSTSAPRLRETSTTTPNGNPPESLVQGHAELLAQPEMDQLGQGKVMPPDPNGLMPVHQYQMEPHDFEFVDQQDWGLADPQKWVVLDPLDPWFDMPEDNAGNYSNHTLDERELL